MTPKLITKDRVLEIARDMEGTTSSDEYLNVFAAALEAELLERLGQGFEEWVESQHGVAPVTQPAAYRAGAASREPEIQALREEVEALRMQVNPEMVDHYQALQEEVEWLNGALAQEKERADFGWQNARTIDKAHQEKWAKLIAAQLSERKLRELWAEVEGKYLSLLKEKDADAAKYKAEGDMYGWNFHEGARSGAVEMHLYMTKLINALSTPTNTDEADKLIQALEAKQAKIDALMLEYCPDEMTQEQRERWAKHQKPTTP